MFCAELVTLVWRLWLWSVDKEKDDLYKNTITQRCCCKQTLLDWINRSKIKQICNFIFDKILWNLILKLIYDRQELKPNTSKKVSEMAYT